jgi:hypothetical protein
MKKRFVSLLLIPSFVFAQHTVALKTGEQMNGTVESMNNGIISFKFKGNDMKLKVSDVSAIYFEAKAAEKPVTSKEPVVKTRAKEAGEKLVTSGSYTVRYKCGTRTIVKPPLISNLTEEKGTVVVDITVDKYGHVMRAEVSPGGTTTQSDYLRTKAMQAAESAMFDNVPTAPLETKGYIIIMY